MERKNLFFKKMKKVFIFPLLLFSFFALCFSILNVNANSYVVVDGETYISNYSSPYVPVSNGSVITFSNFDSDNYFYVIDVIPNGDEPDVENDLFSIVRFSYDSSTNRLNYYFISILRDSFDVVYDIYESGDYTSYTWSLGTYYYDVIEQIDNFYCIHYRTGGSTIYFCNFVDDYYILNYSLVDGPESFLGGILSAITGSFKELGGSIINWIKVGFVQLFTNIEVVEGVNVYHPSEVAYFTFILMGIALACGLTYFIVRLLRRSR